MGTERKRASKRNRFLFLLAVTAVAAFLFPFFAGEFGPGFKLPPVEENRIVHPEGFSIIKPEGWKSHIQSREMSGRSGIDYSPGLKNVRYQPGLYVQILEGNSAPEMDSLSFSGSTFQRAPAVITVGPQGKYYAWRAIFQREGRWFEIALLLPDPHEPMPPEHWKPFIESFRMEPDPTTVPASE